MSRLATPHSPHPTPRTSPPTTAHPSVPTQSQTESVPTHAAAAPSADTAQCSSPRPMPPPYQGAAATDTPSTAATTHSTESISRRRPARQTPTTAVELGCVFPLSLAKRGERGLGGEVLGG